jgi:NitT/TauT family transport system permease protein
VTVSPAADLAVGAPTRRRPLFSRVRILQLAVVCGSVAVLELLRRIGVVNRFTMIPPSEMMLALAHLAATAPWFWIDVSYTLGNLAAATGLSVVGGFLIGVLVHAVARRRRMLDPIFTSYYAVPTFVLYPLLIVFFGIGPMSLIVLGALFGIVAMIVATLTAIDRVPRVLLKTARVARLGPLRTALLMKLPAAAPHLMTGLRLAVAYSVIGTIAGEFILSTEGIGRRVALAYNDFDNQTMYALLVLILAFVIVVNARSPHASRRCAGAGIGHDCMGRNA